MPIFIILALGVGATSTSSCLRALCPTVTERTKVWLTRAPRLCFLSGTLALVIDLALVAVFKMLALPWMLVQVLILTLGLGVVAREVGLRCGLTGIRALIAGQALLLSTLLLPVAGWMVLAGALAAALGAATLAAWQSR